MPLAIASMPMPRASSTIAATMECGCRPVVMRLMNDRSIFRTWIGRSRTLVRDANAGFGERFEGDPHRGGRAVVWSLEDAAFSDLEAQAVGREAVVVENGLDEADEAIAGELADRQVDRHEQGSGRGGVEVGQVGTGGPQDEVVELALQTCIFGDPEKLRGVKQATAGMVPADQCLVADHR
jgi:hypothetical protein